MQIRHLEQMFKFLIKSLLSSKDFWIFENARAFYDKSSAGGKAISNMARNMRGSPRSDGTEAYK
jgi:hypothetical protein